MSEVELLPGETIENTGEEAAAGGDQTRQRHVDQNAPYKSANETERPEWLPEKFFKDGKAQVETLAKSYGELETSFKRKREEIAAEIKAQLIDTSKRPVTAEAYEIPNDLPEFVVVDELKEHPITKWWAQHAFEKGYSTEDFQTGIKQYIEAQASSLPDPEVAMRAEIAKMGENAPARLEAAKLWVKANITDPDELAAVHALASTASGVKLVERLMKASADYRPTDASEGVSGAPQKTRAEIELLMSKPEYWNSSRRDPAVVQEVQDWFAANASK